MSDFNQRFNQNFKMINVGEKTPTHRRAQAFGKIEMALQTAQRIAAREMPKGDVLALAEMAGIMGAKRVSETLPLCHPLPLDAVYVKCVVQDAEVIVSCEVHAFAKTGVEMEALAGVSAALLCVYDLTKGIDPVLTISGIHLGVKEGGKSGVWVNPNHPISQVEAPSELALSGVRVRVLTVSDRCSRGDAQDLSGPKAIEILKAQGAGDISGRVVADEVEAVRAAIEKFSKTEKVDLIVVTGGTGISPRDVTPEALAPLWSKRIPGLGELLRARGAAATPMSWLSRSEVGVVGSTLVALLPGSPRAVAEGLEVLMEHLPHALHVLKGGGH